MTKARARARAKAKAASNPGKRKVANPVKPGNTPERFESGSATISKARNSFDGGGFAVAGRGAGRGR